MSGTLYFFALLCSVMAQRPIDLWSAGRNATGEGSEETCTCDAFLPSSTFPFNELVLIEQAAEEISHELELELGKVEDYETKVTSYAGKILELTVEIEQLENSDDYNEADIQEVNVKIIQLKTLIEELQGSIEGSNAVFNTLRVQITTMVETLNTLETIYDKNKVLEMRREYVKLELQLEECERRHQELFYPNIGSCAHTGITKVSKPIVSQLNAHLSTSYKYGGWGKDSKPLPDRESMYWYSGSSGYSISEIRLYSDYKNLILRNYFQSSTLKSGWTGTGNNFIFRENTLYYQINSPFGLAKLNFTSNQYTSRVIPSASSKFSYAGVSNQNFDFAADEMGLWVTYATEESGGRMVIAKIDEPSFGIEKEWQTSIYKPGVRNAFMVCGVFYAVKAVDTITEEIFYKYDTNTNQESYISILFERFQEKFTNLDYNPTDQKLYMYNDGYYVTYHLWFNHTAEVSVELH
ncbi:uncharacterized protein V6R79_006162 [Siganus canaliculatus]